MPLKGEGTFKTNDRSKTGRIYVPAALVRDSQFPLEEGKVEIMICVDGEKPCICIKQRT